MDAADPTFVKEIEAKAEKGDEACKAAAICLRAIRSVILGNHVQPSPAAYFAGAVAALQKQGGDAASAGTTSALLLLLRKVIPASPPAAVCARLNDLALAITSALRTPDDETLVKQALSCLMAASDAAYSAGNGARPNRKVLKPIFAFLGDSRVPIRHQAELTATLVIKRAASTGDKQTLEFATQHLCAMIAAGRPDKKDPDKIPAQHALTVVKATAASLPLEPLAAVCEALVSLPGSLGQHPCCTASFQFLADHMQREGPDGEDLASDCPELAVKLLPLLLQVPVTMLNVAYVIAYSKALAAACAALSSSESVLAALPPQVVKQKAAAAKRLLGQFAERDPSVLRGTREACLLAFEAAGEGGDLALLESLSESCRPLLGYEAKGAWRHVLPVVTAVFHGIDSIRASRVGPADAAAWTAARFAGAKDLVEQLVQARDKARGGELNFFGDELAECLGAAVSAFGPDNVLQIAELRILETPLGERNFEQLSRSWMLLVLKSSLRRTYVAFFASRFLPIASALKARAAQADASTQSIVGKKYLTLLEQVWALLPGFFDEPLDLNAALLAEGGRLAKQLVGVLLNESDLRESVWAAFAKACSIVQEPPSKLSEALQQSNRTCLQTLSGRILPEMFNAYLKMHAESDGQDMNRSSLARKLALEAVQGLVRLSDPELVAGLFKKMVARLLKAISGEAEAVAEKPNAVALAELSSALVPLVTADVLDLALKVFAPLLSGASAAPEEDRAMASSLQKSAYRAVLGVVKHQACAAGGAAAQEGGSRVLGLWNTLRDARQTCAPGALKARLATIEAMLVLTEQHLSPRFKEPGVRQEYIQCLTTVMPEILFHLRDQSTAVRDAARECLHVAATTAIHQEMQAEIVALISAGLAGLTRHSKASAIDALSRLLYEHHSRFADDLQDRLIGVVLILLADGDAQVWRAALKFCKVVVFVVPKSRLPKHLPQLLCLFESKHLATAKMLVRAIVERLVKVLPAEVLAEEFPEKHGPLLHYVQRQVARQGRPKSTRAAKPEDDEGGDQGGGEKADAAMGGMDDEDDAPKASWDAFQGDDDGKAAAAAAAAGAGAGDQAAGRKRGRSAEPPTNAVMAHDAVQALLDAWEAESDGSDDDMGGGGGRGRKRGGGGGKRKRDNEAFTTWIHEDADVPLDFMSADAAHSVLTTRAAPTKRRRGHEVGGAGATSRTEALRRSGLRFAEDGRLVIDEEEEPEKEAGEKKAGFTIGSNSGSGKAGAKKEKALSKLATLRKQRAEAKALAKVARRGGHMIKGLDAFKPGKKRADGDAVRQGQALQPYAYVRLNPKITKEKFKDKAAASFNKVVKGAKKGVVRGNKAKARDLRLRKAKEAKDKRRKAGKPKKIGSR